MKSEQKVTPTRRQFLKTGILGAGTVAGASVLDQTAFAMAEQSDAGPALTAGDMAILQFLAAAETLESDLWQQYTELAGIGAPPSGYASGLAVLDEDMNQYISDNTDDEMSHERFLNAYITAKGGQPVDLDQFRTLPGSQATGAKAIGRLTNLLQLTVDTSWWTRYRSNRNPDLGATFPPIVPSLNVGQHPAIPRNDAESGDSTQISAHAQAMANTAAFHFAFIEQGGTSLYAAMAQKATSLQVLRILVSIGGSEIAHFQTWHDKAGNAPAVTDGELVFPDFESPELSGEDVKKNLIMPEPCEFLSRRFPVCSIIRPTARQDAAKGAAEALTQDGLFLGQSQHFFQALHDLAADADRARRGV
jgi:hypothetical protein